MIPILIDINVCHLIFKDNPEGIHEYIFNSLISKKTRLVYGGTKYLSELSKLNKIAVLINLYKDRKEIDIVLLNKADVDDCAERIKQSCQDSDFDDEHLLAIVFKGKVSVVCSNDSRADKYIKNKSLYPEKITKPKICRELEHKSLLGY